MPTYDYKCTMCGKTFTVEHSINKKFSGKCPNCKCKSVKRLISSDITFVLKGNGWAKDGYSK